MDVAVLFARADSIYKSLDRCDVYDIERDALTFTGGMPVVAHPPCRSWGRLRQYAKPLPGETALALWAVDQVRQHGGVLEHPEASRLWREKPLPLPGQGRDEYGGWTLPVFQHWWGHRAAKATWFYICGIDPAAIPPIPLRLDDPRYAIGTSKRLPEVSRSEREGTPPLLALWLCDLARRCRPQRNVTLHDVTSRAALP